MGPGDDEPRPVGCIEVTGDVVGWVDYDTDRDWLEPGEVNVGYSIFAPHRRNGYATRAVELLIRHLREHTAVRTATVSIDPRNAASIGVARRAGFHPVSTDRDVLYFKRSVRAT